MATPPRRASQGTPSRWNLQMLPPAPTPSSLLSCQAWQQNCPSCLGIAGQGHPESSQCSG